MLLSAGHWNGKGTFWFDGESLGQVIRCKLAVTEDDVSSNIKAEIDRGDPEYSAISIEVVPNQEGTYSLQVRILGDSFLGISKLDSVPHLGLIWNEPRTLSATFTIFTVDQGLGFRGFANKDGQICTWEVVFMQEVAARADNVLAFRKGR